MSTIIDLNLLKMTFVTVLLKRTDSLARLYEVEKELYVRRPIFSLL